MAKPAPAKPDANRMEFVARPPGQRWGTPMVNLTGTTGPQGEPGPGLDPGVILWWNTLSGPIPAGWLVCDGENGTADLRARNVKGTGYALAYIQKA